jgi:6-phosphogluconolactonase/glucosamine-6-phosphate isomerase/deaminase
VPDVIIDARDSLAFECGRRLERASAAAIASSGRFSCALPGGSVAEACVPVFAHANVDWLQSSVFWCDERAVPPSDPQSNYGLAWRLWLRDGAVPADRIHRMPADVSNERRRRTKTNFARRLEIRLGWIGS